ncbi:hypothetical protein VNO77_23025 [Canavalia gladiata]|uniref:Uncharacterized protein n=1 Tax=Canavalia gladiata TaxID=3824 RepID=A0AAN9QBC3_CANGL
MGSLIQGDIRMPKPRLDRSRNAGSHRRLKRDAHSVNEETIASRSLLQELGGSSQGKLCRRLWLSRLHQFVELRLILKLVMASKTDVQGIHDYANIGFQGPCKKNVDVGLWGPAPPVPPAHANIGTNMGASLALSGGHFSH